MTMTPWKRPLGWRCPVFGLLAVAIVVLAATSEAQQGNPKWEVLNNKATGNFIVALAQDLQGAIWVGTEDQGVFRYDPKAAEGKQWTQFNSKNGLGDDNAYAIAVDKLGRVWVGTLNHGVSVYNGKDWKNYDVLDGPIGERIFAITTCPTDGDVWMATSAGLTRFSVKNDAWSYYTRADGLPEDQANAIAFDAQGNVYVGTQCHGIASATAAGEYKKWTVASGPTQLGTTPNGTGLPSSLINALLVNRDGTIFAGTTAGLAWSKDKGKTWSYIRGRDYAAKVKGRWGGAPAGWKEAAKQVMDGLVPEDYVTCLAESDDNLIWIGFRQQGHLAVDAKTFRHVFYGNPKKDGLPNEYVFTILPMSDFRPWVGTYGAGLAHAKQPFKTVGAKVVPKARADEKRAMPDLPSAAKPPSAADLTAMCDELAKLTPGKPTAQKNAIIVLEDDWRTQGNWIDRYGRFAAVLCAMGGGGNDFLQGYHASWIEHRHWIGRNCDKGDRLRHWIHWPATENTRCLQNPILGGRRQSEHDDHGETYPMAKDGPHVYGTIRVPKGDYIVSCYLMNKDGHEGNNRSRDYLMELKPTPMSQDKFDKLGFAHMEAEALFEQATTGVRSRVPAFWGGVHKRFLIRAPESSYYTIRINRNHSFNTILSAIFIDPVGDLCGPGGPIRDAAPARTAQFQDNSSATVSKNEAELACCVVDRLLVLRDTNPIWYSQNARPYLIQLLRVLLVREKKSARLANDIERLGKYKNIRIDIATCLNDLQFFERRDRVYEYPQYTQYFRWLNVTKFGPNWSWDEAAFGDYLKVRRSQQSWD